MSGTITGGGAATGNTLTARDVANTWAINAADAGSVTNVNAFTGAGNLTGGTNTDSFTLSGTGSVSGTITGGGAATGNTLTARDVANTWAINAAKCGQHCDQRQCLHGRWQSDRWDEHRFVHAERHRQRQAGRSRAGVRPRATR